MAARHRDEVVRRFVFQAIGGCIGTAIACAVMFVEPGDSIALGAAAGAIGSISGMALGLMVYGLHR